MVDSTAVADSSQPKRATRRVLYREVHGMTDVGLVREGNEDALVLMDDEDLFVVADGMGGHACGEVASAFTIEAIKAFYRSSDITRRVRSAHRRAIKGGTDAQRDVSYHALRLRKAVESANISVFRLAQQHEQLRDMGTTVVATAFAGNRLYVANVGDSRVYRLRANGRTSAREIEQLTEDHSLLNEYIKMNLLGPEEIENFPYKNVIVRALGLQEQVVVDIFDFGVRMGDQVLLCSDGLTDLVRDHEIRDVLADAPTAEAACIRLTEMAKARGGHDNITTLVIRLHGRAPQPRPRVVPPVPSQAAAAASEGFPSIPPPPPGPAPIHGSPSTRAPV